MKKEMLYEILITSNISNNIIVENLDLMINLKGLDSKLFYETMLKNKNIINDKNYYDILKIFFTLIYFESNSAKVRFCEMINDFLDNDYIMSCDDINYILNSIANFLNFPVLESFDITIEEKDYYTLQVIKNYLDIFSQLKKYKEIIYEHDFIKITNQYNFLLEDLCNTEIKEQDDFNETLIKRINLFIKIITDEEIFKLEEDKYNAVLEVSSSIISICELSKFKNRVVRIKKDTGYDEFIRIIEKYSSEFSSNTLDIIFDELELQEKILPNGEKRIVGFECNKDTNQILKKILVNNENDNVVKF